MLFKVGPIKICLSGIKDEGEEVEDVDLVGISLLLLFLPPETCSFRLYLQNCKPPKVIRFSQVKIEQEVDENESQQNQNRLVNGSIYVL